MADTQQQQDLHRNPEKNNAPSGRITAANNGTPTANNTTNTRTFSLEGVQVNPRYFTSIPGILKLVEWVLAIICIACAAPALLKAIHWFLFVVVICFIFTFLWMCIHFFTITNVVPKLPWRLMELSYTAAATILYFIAMVVMLEQVDRNKPWLVPYYGQSRWDTYITAGDRAIDFLILNMIQIFEMLALKAAYAPLMMSPAVVTLCIIAWYRPYGPSKTCFALFNMVVYAVETAYHFKEWMDSRHQ